MRKYNTTTREQNYTVTTRSDGIHYDVHNRVAKWMKCIVKNLTASVSLKGETAKIIIRQNYANFRKELHFSDANRSQVFLHCNNPPIHTRAICHTMINKILLHVTKVNMLRLRMLQPESSNAIISQVKSNIERWRVLLPKENVTNISQSSALVKLQSFLHVSDGIKIAMAARIRTTKYLQSNNDVISFIQTKPDLLCLRHSKISDIAYDDFGNSYRLSNISDQPLSSLKTKKY